LSLRLEVLIKPCNCLQKGRLFGKANGRLSDICPDSKPVLNATEQVDLVRLASFGQDILGFMALRGGKD
jgi:hypothetical protein